MPKHTEGQEAEERRYILIEVSGNDANFEKVNINPWEAIGLLTSFIAALTESCRPKKGKAADAKR